MFIVVALDSPKHLQHGQILQRSRSDKTSDRVDQLAPGHVQLLRHRLAPRLARLLLAHLSAASAKQRLLSESVQHQLQHAAHVDRARLMLREHLSELWSTKQQWLLSESIRSVRLIRPTV